MSTLLWLAWFCVSRTIAYFAVLGAWAFSGLLCLVGGPGRPAPPEIWALYWLLGTIALVPIIIWYTLYNVRVLVRKIGPLPDGD